MSAIESSCESSRPAKGKGGGGKGGSGGGSGGGGGGKGGRGGSGGSGGGEDRRREGTTRRRGVLLPTTLPPSARIPSTAPQTAAWQSHAVEVSRAGFMPRVTLEESMCVKRLRIKSRPGLTAFEAGSVAYIEMTLNAVAANEGSVPASPSAAGHLSPPPPPAPARATVSAAPGSLAAVTGEGIERAEATLTYLSSYEGMGIAQLGCTRGCLCDTHVVDAHRGEEETTQRRVSVYKTLTFQLHLDSQRRCVLRLEVLPATRSDGGHKFKVSELALVVRLPRHPRGNATSPSEVSGLKGGGLCVDGTPRGGAHSLHTACTQPLKSHILQSRPRGRCVLTVHVPPCARTRYRYCSESVSLTYTVRTHLIFPWFVHGCCVLHNLPRRRGTSFAFGGDLRSSRFE